MKVNYLILALPWGCALAGPTVNLGYSEYQGVTLQTVDQFLGMRYAAPPTGNSRWRTPSAPLSTSGVQDATEVRSSVPWNKKRTKLHTQWHTY